MNMTVSMTVHWSLSGIYYRIEQNFCKISWFQGNGSVNHNYYMYYFLKTTKILLHTVSCIKVQWSLDYKTTPWERQKVVLYCRWSCLIKGGWNVRKTHRCFRKWSNKAGGLWMQGSYNPGTTVVLSYGGILGQRSLCMTIKMYALTFASILFLRTWDGGSHAWCVIRHAVRILCIVSFVGSFLYL